MKHIFSLFHQLNFQKEINNNIFISNNSQLNSRIINTLRLKESEEIILFNYEFKLNLIINKIENKIINFNILKLKKIEIIKPKIIIYMPVIEKEYIEEALRGCAQTGTCEIRFVKYEKSNFKLNLDKKKLDRFEKVLIASCEQSKQFYIPKISNKIYNFKDMILEENLIWLSIDGIKILDFINNKNNRINNNLFSNLTFTCGPEGGYSENEINKLKQKYINLEVSLGNVIYRSCDTINNMTCILRLLNK